MSDSDYITAFAPATIGNLGVGFDMLGLAITGAGDRVSARKVDSGTVAINEIREISGEMHSHLSANADENTASIAARSLWNEVGDGSGIELILYKGVPLQSGMGSSAASAVAAAVAVNALLDAPLDIEDVLVHALAGEKFASGGLHADNVAPCLIGGLVLCPQVLLPKMIALSVPEGISSVLIHPELEVNTAVSRNGLASDYSMDQWLTQQGYLAGFIAACEQNNVELLAACLRDETIEPQRAASVSCFPTVKEVAMASGALGCSISGSGPSIFALCRDADAATLATEMELACRNSGIECQSWISPLDSPGARVED